MITYSYILQSIVEIVLLLSYPFLSIPWFFKPQILRKTRRKNVIPIIIVEQWLTPNVSHLLMKRYFENEGYQVYMFNYSFLRGGVDDGAVSLKQYISKHNIKRCVLVGISIGAVTAYTYVQRHNGWRNVAKVISLGGPFKGTPWIFFILFTKTGQQLLPRSSFLRSLLQEKNKHSEKILFVIAKFDELVPRFSSSLLRSKSHVIDIIGHNNLHIWSKETFKLIVNETKRLND